MAHKRTALTIGRGRLYFDRFRPGTTTGEGELYFGNTPDLSINRSITTTDEWESDGDERHQVEGVIIEQSHEAKFATDHMSSDNVALWYGNAPQKIWTPALQSQVETRIVKKGRSYQLGATATRPFGLRGVTQVSISRDGVVLDDAVTFNQNFEFDGPAGRLFIKVDAPDIIDGDTLRITFTHQSSLGQRVVSGKTELLGSLRFESTNPIGPKFNFFFPSVAIESSSTVDLKSESWLKLQFTASARKLTSKSEYVYVESTGDFGNLTPAEVAILNLGITPGQFIPLEDKLDTLINTIMPSRGYPV